MSPLSPEAPPPIRIVADGFTLPSGLAAHITRKAGTLLRHLHPRVGVVRVSLKCETPRTGPLQFTVCATAEHTGVDHVAHAVAAQPQAGADAALDKLERVLTAAAGMRKHRRRAPGRRPAPPAEPGQ